MVSRGVEGCRGVSSWSSWHGVSRCRVGVELVSRFGVEVSRPGLSFGAAGAILLLTVSTPHAFSEALPTSPDVARTPPGMAGPVVAWSLDDAATACKHEPRIVREHARKADGMARPFCFERTER